MNLVEILKDCPKGTKLYSTIYGIVEFDCVKDDSEYSIVIDTIQYNLSKMIAADGRLYKDYNGECTLFPSKDQRDWSKFTAPWYKKEMSTIARIEKQGEQEEPQVYETEDGKIITYSETDGYKFDEPNFHENERAWLYLVSDVLTWKDGIGQYLDDKRVQELAKKLCSKYSQKLYNSSVLSNSLNPGENKQKFNPKTLKPFDKVLVRDFPNIEWSCNIFSHVQNPEEVFICTACSYDFCIPYNEDTKHLVGTKEEAPEYYRYWED